jgi:amino-acid N-acetyltransferase
MSAVTFRPAHDSDWEPVADLLTAAHLPLEGARENLLGFILAWRDDELIGCAGLERYKGVGLLRSVAVREAERGSGLGKTLTGQVLEQARQTGLRQIILLTETAQGFFPKFGFTPITRAEVPSEALASVEFTTACPESAVVMLTQLG